MGKFQAYGSEAEKMFVERGLSCSEIAKILPLSEQTLSAWRNKFKWDEKRLRF
jgi:transposase